MSLQVWLPLNGNLNNQGLSNLTFSNENTTNLTTDTTGKIGNCYKRATYKTAGRIISNSTINLNGDLSMACWAKVTQTVGNTANGLITNHSHNDNTGFGITVKHISDSDYRISCSTGNGSGRTYMNYYGTTNIKNTWHHLALTYDNTKHEFKLWVDGICEITQSYTNSSKDDKIILFDWSTTYNDISYRPACYLNDVRIYDHCLSPKEVKEISKGLVLHYKLDKTVGGNKNYLKNSNFTQGTNGFTGYTATGSTCTKQNDCMKVVSTGASSGFYTNNFDAIDTNIMTTFSAYVKAENSMTIYIGTDGSGNGNCSSYIIGTTWQKISISKTKTTNNPNLRIYGQGTFYVKLLK